jgi:hypothetical protein
MWGAGAAKLTLPVFVSDVLTFSSKEGHERIGCLTVSLVLGTEKVETSD